MLGWFPIHTFLNRYYVCMGAFSMSILLFCRFVPQLGKTRFYYGKTRFIATHE